MWSEKEYKGRWSHYYKIRGAVYKFLEIPATLLPKLYHSFVFLLIVVSFCFSVIQSISQYETNETLLELVAMYECCLLAIFVTECFLRIWSCGTNRKYRGGRGNFDWGSILIILGTVTWLHVANNRGGTIRAGATLLHQMKYTANERRLN